MSIEEFPELIDVRTVARRIGMGRSFIYAAMAEGAFPLPLRVGRRSVRWRADEVAAWLAARPMAGSLVRKAK